MDETRRRRLSKRLSYHLRHGPGDAGVELDRGGWADLGALLDGMASRAGGPPATREDVERVIATSDKQRFELSDDGRRIRARYGHSVPVDLSLPPADPPATLFHGTTPAALPSIRRVGLTPQGRRQVHLSTERDQARRVGSRHGRPVVVEVDAGGLVGDGWRLVRATEEVWLADRVPPAYLRVPDV